MSSVGLKGQVSHNNFLLAIVVGSVVFDICVFRWPMQFSSFCSYPVMEFAGYDVMVLSLYGATRSCVCFA